MAILQRLISSILECFLLGKSSPRLEKRLMLLRRQSCSMSEPITAPRRVVWLRSHTFLPPTGSSYTWPQPRPFTLLGVTRLESEQYDQQTIWFDYREQEESGVCMDGETDSCWKPAPFKHTHPRLTPPRDRGLPAAHSRGPVSRVSGGPLKGINGGTCCYDTNIPSSALERRSWSKGAWWM